ncbi:MAG: 30S ribosomal protein S6, partial [Treponema sp.]
PLDEEKSSQGKEAVRKVLTSFGADIEKEELFGDRDLAYEVAKQRRGRFILFTLKINPDKISEVEKEFKITQNLLKYLFVKIEEK